ncbi:MAG: hypothetical protein EBY80_01750 [Actinobacteria bacterium]|nr:hypothetical protein [Actinomycetota bacterium]
MIKFSHARVSFACALALSASLLAACSGGDDESGDATTASEGATMPATDSTEASPDASDSTLPPAVVGPTAMGEITDEFLANAPLADGECGSVAEVAGATRLTNGSLPEFDAWAMAIQNGEIEPPPADPNDPQLNIGDLSSYGGYHFDFTVLARGDIDGDGLQDALVRVICQHGGWAGKYPVSMYLSSRTAPFELSECYFALFDTWVYADFQQSNIPSPDISGNTYPDNGPMFHVRHQAEAWDYLVTLEYEDSSGVLNVSSVESCELSWDASMNDINVTTYGWGG